jgi:hypothetical protein
MPTLSELREALASDDAPCSDLLLLIDALKRRKINLFLLDKETRTWWVYLSMVEVSLSR